MWQAERREIPGSVTTRAQELRMEDRDGESKDERPRNEDGISRPGKESDQSCARVMAAWQKYLSFRFYLSWCWCFVKRGRFFKFFMKPKRRGNFAQAKNDMRDEI